MAMPLSLWCGMASLKRLARLEEQLVTVCWYPIRLVHRILEWILGTYSTGDQRKNHLAVPLHIHYCSSPAITVLQSFTDKRLPFGRKPWQRISEPLNKVAGVILKLAGRETTHTWCIQSRGFPMFGESGCPGAAQQQGSE